MKYRNTKTTVFGITFDSKKEAERYMELKAMEQRLEIAFLETQVRYRLEVNGEHVCDYIADFQYITKDGIVVEDVKGYKAGGAYNMFRLKAKLMRAILGITVDVI